MFFHVDMTRGALIGRTPQKFCRLTAITLQVLFFVSFIFLLPTNNKKNSHPKCCFPAPLNMTAYQKMVNIANILPILVIFCKEITKHFGCDIVEYWLVNH
jgi:hypothetical protein